MKKLKVEGKLNLNKERVSMLNDSEMGAVQGGNFRITSIGRRCSKAACTGSNGVRTQGWFCNDKK